MNAEKIISETIAMHSLTSNMQFSWVIYTAIHVKQVYSIMVSETYYSQNPLQVFSHEFLRLATNYKNKKIASL